MTLTVGTPVVHHSELRRRGWAPTEIAAAVRRGELVRLVRGTYLKDPSAHHLIRAVAERSPDFVVSHGSAALLHGMPIRPDGRRVHLTHDSGGPGRVQPHRVIHTGRLDREDHTMLDGLKVTTAPRTLVDLGRTSPFVEAVAAADHALRMGIVDPVDVLRAVKAAHHRPGMRAARRALAFADGRAESPGESRMRVAFDQLGLEPPALQVTIVGESGRMLGRADAGHLEDNCLYEYDGRIKYTEPYVGDAHTALMREKRREDAIRALGYILCRLTAQDLADLQALYAKVERARAAGRRMAAAGVTDGWAHVAAPITFGLSV